MLRRREGDLEIAIGPLVPPVHLVHFLEAEIVDKIRHARGHNDRLPRRDRAQRAAIEVIKVRVRDEDKVDIGQVLDGKPGALQPLDHDEPVGPVGVDQDVVLRRLDEKRGVADPRQPDLARRERGENGAMLDAGLALEERRNQNFRDEVALAPARRLFFSSCVWVGFPPFRSEPPINVHQARPGATLKAWWSEQSDNET